MGIYQKLFIASFQLGELLNEKNPKELEKEVDKAKKDISMVGENELVVPYNKCMFVSIFGLIGRKSGWVTNLDDSNNV
jgi:hypothetical protein